MNAFDVRREQNLGDVSKPNRKDSIREGRPTRNGIQEQSRGGADLRYVREEGRLTRFAAFHLELLHWTYCASAAYALRFGKQHRQLTQ